MSVHTDSRKDAAPLRTVMARRVKHEQHENHERWLISYADFITLLFAFFVVMFASSQADKNKASKVSASVKEALEQGHMPKAFMEMMGRRRPPETTDPKKAAEVAKDEGVSLDSAMAALAELTPSLQSLTNSLDQEIKDGKVAINMEPRGVVVSLKEAAFFPPARDVIETSAYPIIGKIAESARKLTNRVLLEGHTDSTPIRNERFRSNWDLSASRAIAMLNVLADKFEVPRERMSVSGYADNLPVADNATPEGRKKNRRVDVVFLNEFGSKAQPGRK